MVEAVDGHSRFPLERARLAAGMTQEELAERAGVSVRGLRNLERGLIRRPRNSSLAAIADALGLSELERRAFLDHYRVGPAGSALVGGRPEQLPRAPVSFVGRDDVLATLDDLLSDGPRGQCIVLHGPAGVGKSALALFWADAARDRFADGRLFVDLHGFGGVRPADPSAVLEWFLRALGVRADEIPDELDARAAMYRSWVADRRLVVLLDNARSAAQVRPLLSGAAPLVTIVTSRVRLSGLNARDGAHSIEVAPLPRADATGLMTTLLGSARVAADYTALERIVGLCAGLPLAISVVGERIAARPERPLATVLGELRNDQSRLSALGVANDELCDIRTALSWSVELLAPLAQRVFRLLAVHPGPHFDAGIASALADIGLPTATQVLELLADLHLVETDGDDRYRFHDLVRIYAGEMLERWESRAEQRAAEVRLHEHFARLACRAVALVDPPERAYLPDLPGPIFPTLDDREAADAWLDTQRANLLAVVATMDASDATTVSIYSDALWRHLHYRGLHSDALFLHGTAARLAESANDDAARGRALRQLGATNFALGRVELARDQLVQAADIAHRADHPLREARAVSFLGVVHKDLAQYDAALACHERAAELSRAAGNLAGIGTSLGNAGIVLLKLERFADALAQFNNVKAYADATGDQLTRAANYGNIGRCYLALDHIDEAAAALEQSLELAIAAGYAHGEGVARVGLARACHTLHNDPQAVRHLNRAREIAVGTSNAALEIEVSNLDGLIAHDHGQHNDAIEHYEHALAMARLIKDRHQQAQVHEGLAAVHRSQHHRTRADYHLGQASAIYADLNLPHPLGAFEPTPAG